MGAPDSVESVGHIQCYCPALQKPHIAINHRIWSELMFSIRKSSTEMVDASTVLNAWITIARASARYALSGVRGVPRAKGAAARVDGLVIEFERADVVEDIMTEARGPRI